MLALAVLLRFASGQVLPPPRDWAGWPSATATGLDRRRVRRRRLVLVPLGRRQSARGCATGLGISSQRRGSQETPTARRDARSVRGRRSARARTSQRFLPIRSRRPGGKSSSSRMPNRLTSVMAADAAGIQSCRRQPEPVRSTMIDYMGMPDRAGTRIVVKRPIEPWRELPVLSAERTITARAVKRDPALVNRV
jgi:hypothetical protein